MFGNGDKEIYKVESSTWIWSNHMVSCFVPCFFFLFGFFVGSVAGFGGMSVFILPQELTSPR